MASTQAGVPAGRRRRRTVAGLALEIIVLAVWSKGADSLAKIVSIVKWTDRLQSDRFRHGVDAYIFRRTGSGVGSQTTRIDPGRFGKRS